MNPAPEALAPPPGSRPLAAPTPDERPRLWHALRLFRSSPASAWIAVACVLIHSLGFYWGQGSDTVLWLMGANHGELVARGEVHRLLTAMFLHGSGLHLCLNLSALMALGPMLELFLGSRKFLSLYTSCGLAGSVASALAHPEVFGVGASGAIFGLFAVIVATELRTMRQRGARVRPNYRLWGAVLLNVLLSLVPGVDAAAHLGGAALGLAVGALASPDIFDVSRLPSRRVRARPGSWSTLGAGACVLALAASFGVAFALGRPWQLGRPARLASTAVSVTGLSLELPELLLEEPSINGDENDGGIVYGTEFAAPLRVAVSFERHGVLGSIEALQRELEQERQPSHRGGTLVAQDRVMLGERPVIRRRERLESGERLLRYDLYVGPFLVRVLVVRRTDARKIWPGVEERIAASVRFEPPG